MFGSPAILALPAGFHVITTKIWSLFQYPPKPGLAAAASLPLLLITVLLLLGQSWILGRKGYTVLRRQERRAADHRARPLEVGWPSLSPFVVLSLTVILPYLALLKTALTRTLSEPLTWATLTLHHCPLRVLRVLGHPAGDAEHVPARLPDRHHRHRHRARGRLPRVAQLGAGRSAARLCSRRRRSPFRASCWASACSSAYSQPAIPCSTARSGSCSIAFLTIEMPVGYQQCRRPFHGIHPELEEASRILGATPPRRRCARSPRRCCAPASSPPGASSSSAPSASCRRRSCSPPPTPSSCR